MTQKRFAYLERIGPMDWKFEFSQEKWESDEHLDRAIDLMEDAHLARAERIFRRLIARYPYHFDAYHHLAILIGMTGDEDEAMKLRSNAVKLGFLLFPKGFDIKKHKLEWGWLENRPFLRVYEGLALDYQHAKRLREAIEIFENIISLNPNDNQGCRCSAIWCYFELNEPDRVLDICGKYKEDLMPELSYGKVLALFQKNMQDEAKEAAKEAIRDMPLVARELTSERHKVAKGETPEYVTIGGRDQAYAYWSDFGEYWKKTVGSLEFLKECVKETKKEPGRE